MFAEVLFSDNRPKERETPPPISRPISRGNINTRQRAKSVVLLKANSV
jgi:hypothetical protein